MSTISTMRDRRPGQLVIDRLLAEQALLNPQSRLARVLGVSPLGPNSVSWYLGALGEIAVGDILDSLPGEWAVFHALPIGTGESDIDHLVIGPSGAYAINTKHHAGKSIWVGGRGFLVEGQKKHYISNSESEATKVTRLLRQLVPNFPAATPVIAVVNPKDITIKKRPDTVQVMDAKRLRRWLTKQPAAIDFEDFGRVVDYLDNPRLWRQEPPVIEGSRAGFVVLDREVRSARTRRLLWLTLAIAAAVVIAMNVLPSLIPHL